MSHQLDMRIGGVWHADAIWNMGWLCLEPVWQCLCGVSDRMFFGFSLLVRSGVASVSSTNGRPASVTGGLRLSVASGPASSDSAKHQKYTWPGSNWRPSACEVDVIAAKPHMLKHICQISSMMPAPAKSSTLDDEASQSQALCRCA